MRESHWIVRRARNCVFSISVMQAKSSESTATSMSLYLFAWLRAYEQYKVTCCTCKSSSSAHQRLSHLLDFGSRANHFRNPLVYSRFPN